MRTPYPSYASMAVAPPHLVSALLVLPLQHGSALHIVLVPWYQSGCQVMLPLQRYIFMEAPFMARMHKNQMHKKQYLDAHTYDVHDPLPTSVLGLCGQPGTTKLHNSDIMSWPSGNHFVGWLWNCSPYPSTAPLCFDECSLNSYVVQSSGLRCKDTSTRTFSSLTSNRAVWSLPVAICYRLGRGERHVLVDPHFASCSQVYV